jgi:glycerophosphoryl diester phosphodiesterase
MKPFLTLAAFFLTSLTVSACAGVPELQLQDRLDGSREPVRIAAHRGASAIAPENTRAAIDAAIDAEAELIEFDVRVTADGHLLLFHDDTLERFGGGKKKFADLDAATARRIDVGSFFDASFSDERPPTLAEAVEQCLEGGAIPLIEHKTGEPAAYLAVLKELDAVDKVIVQSFNWDFLAGLRALDADIKLGALGKDKVSDGKLATITAFSPAMVGWKDADITSPAIERFHQADLAVAVWTVNNERRMKALAAAGIDILITDKPEEAKTVLHEE